MKKHSIVLVALASLLTLASCNEETPGSDSTDSGVSTGEVSSPGNTESSEAEVTYNIAVNNPTGATITTNVNEAKAGDTVIFTIAIADTYHKALGEVKVTKGNEDIAYELNDGTYSFTMPKGDVAIQATLIDVNHSFGITVNKDSHITNATFKIDGVILQDGEKVLAGKKVEMIVSMEENYFLDGEPTTSLSGLTFEKSGDTYSFTMPEEDVTITLKSKYVAPSHSISVNPVEGATVNLNQTTTKAGETVTFTIAITDQEKELGEVKVLFGTTEIKYALNDGVYTFTMPEGDVTINVTLKNVIHTYSLSYTKDEHITAVTFEVDGTTLGENPQIEAGKSITMTLTLLDGYELDGVPTLSVAGTTLTTITEGTSYSFTMPAENLTVTLNSKAKEIVSVESSIRKIDFSTKFIKYVKSDADFTIDLANKKYQSGEKVEFYVKIVTNNQSGITASSYNYAFLINGNEKIALERVGNSTSTKLKGTFVMPASDVEILVFPVNKESTTPSTSFIFNFEVNQELYDVYGVESGKRYSTSSPLPFVIKPKKDNVKINKPTATYKTSSKSGTVYITQETGSNCFFCANTNNANYKQSTITMTIDAQEVTLHQVTFNDTDKVTVSGEYLKGFEANESANFTLKAKYPYYVKGVKSIVGADGTDYSTTVTNYLTTYGDLTLYLYNLPDQDIIVTLDIDEGIPVEVEKGDYIESYTVTNITSDSKEVPQDATSPLAYKGATLKIVPTLSSGVTTSKSDITAYCNGEKMVYSSGGFTFAIPESPAVEKYTITFLVPTKHTIGYDAAAKEYSLTSLSASSAFAGEDISFYLKANVGYKIDAVSLSNGGEVTKGDDGKYHFSMPDENVTVVVKTIAVTTYTITLEKDEGVASLLFTDESGDTVLPPENGKIVINEGTKLTLKVTTNNGYDLTKVLFGETDITSDMEFTVTMNQTLKVTTTEQAKAKVNVVITGPSETEVTVNVFDNNNTRSDSTCYIGHTVNVKFYLKGTISKNYETIVKSQFKVTSGKNDVLFTYDITNGVSFTMPDGEVTITFTPVLKDTTSSSN